MKAKIYTTLFVALLLSCHGIAKNPVDLKAGFKMGNPGIQSIKAIAFGPENILFVGDNKGMTLYAIDVKGLPGEAPAALSIAAIDQKLAAAMGTQEVKILDMAVNPASKQVFFAVSKGGYQYDTLCAIPP